MHSFVDSVMTVLQIGPRDAVHIRSMVETACEDHVVVTQVRSIHFYRLYVTWPYPGF